MANDVFANGREISCKKADGKTIAAFPDVCFTPPENPATPPGIPVPYPNTAFAKDTSSGSKNVKISDQEIMLKNKSFFKTSTGDEAGCAAKKGIITSKIKGKAYFVSWSMDVKAEGENVVRHIDMTTHNHASPLGNEGIPWPHIDSMSLINSVEDCDKEKDKIEEECGKPIDENKAKCPNPTALNDAKQKHKDACAMPCGDARDAAKAAATLKVHAAHESYALDIHDNKCTKVLRCALVPYDKGKKSACCPHQTPDHLVPGAQFGSNRGKKHPKYNVNKAPCMCASGGAHTATHGRLGQARTSYMIEKGIPVNQDGPVWTVEQSCECGAESAAKVSGCTKGCLEAQLKKGHEDMDVDLGEKISTKKESVAETDVDLSAMQDLMDEFPLTF